MIRILVESSTHHCRNSGDMAMMLAAMERIEEHCPGAEIRMVTRAPELLAKFFPRALPVPSAIRNAWLESRSLLGHRRLPAPMSRLVNKLEYGIWTRLPALSAGGMRLKQRLLGYERVDPSRFLHEIRSSDLVLACGMGALNDAFYRSTLALLNVYAAAIHNQVPVVLFGQGIGPISNPDLLRKAGEVLPRVRFIGLREGRVALPLLASLGVPASSIEVTGDDAIELAYRGRRQELGTGIGVNVRVASYAGTDGEFAALVRSTLESGARKFGARLIPVPISTYSDESDALHLQEMAAGSAHLWAGDFDLDDPMRVMQQAGECRVVVTGSYHAAVFALAQGIPAVCMERSAYYSQKFRGLEAQFGAGCTVIPVAGPNFANRLEQALECLWHSADRLRPSLLQAAARQIEKGRRAYAQVFGQFASRDAALQSAVDMVL